MSGIGRTERPLDFRANDIRVSQEAMIDNAERSTSIVTGAVSPWVNIQLPQPDTLYGAQTDGFVALVALAIALLRPGGAPLAWARVLAFAVCMLTGLAN